MIINKTREKEKHFRSLEWPTSKYRRNGRIKKSPSCKNHSKNRIRQETPIKAKRGGGQSLERNRRFTKPQSLVPQITYKSGKDKETTIQWSKEETSLRA